MVVTLDILNSMYSLIAYQKERAKVLFGSVSSYIICSLRDEIIRVDGKIYYISVSQSISWSKMERNYQEPAELPPGVTLADHDVGTLPPN
jgi:hypothetical protein